MMYDTGLAQTPPWLPQTMTLDLCQRTQACKLLASKLCTLHYTAHGNAAYTRAAL